MNTQHQHTTLDRSTRLLVKGIITGVLILAMLIPTIFVNNIIKEREDRQKQVVREVSSKWASAQTISGVYIVVPYTETYIAADNKPAVARKNLVLLPDNLSVNGTVTPQETHRSIYQVLLYRSQVQLKGAFNIHIPDEIPKENIEFSRARICMGISDFRGIEEMINVRFKDEVARLTPGLPSSEIDSKGLSAPISFTAADLDHPLNFETAVRIKGSEQLHFVPLAANSEFNISSPWQDPSFDGNTIPVTRTISAKGFNATWRFNQANLPFTTAFSDGTLKDSLSSFGVTMLQPADEYDKTMRSVKYAILFIGLTFALFFIIELMQQKPVHPVQYVLIGLALVIFYTLLLSISEFLNFNTAYLIAAAATVLLISTYAKSHFQSWKTASIFAGVLGGLYVFTFILISLEDTALLVGSIGLFIVLAAVMYASRKVNWYGIADEASTPVPVSNTNTAI